MRRLVSIIIIMIGILMLAFGAFSWTDLINNAWEHGGMAATGVFYFLLFGGGLGMIVLGVLLIKQSRILEPNDGIDHREPDWDVDYDDGQD